MYQTAIGCFVQNNMDLNTNFECNQVFVDKVQKNRDSLSK